jgi:lipopolysaccharide transport system ATP-binding protein
MSEAVVTFENVGKSYPQYQHVLGGLKNLLFNLPAALRSWKQVRFESLRDISFEVKPGECLGIVGRNGAGKSTTLGLIAGVLRPTQGRVMVRKRVSPLLELGAGFSGDLTGRENIYLNGILMGMTRADVAKREKSIVEFSELGDFIDQPIRVYSSGMMARLGFSVVSGLEPELMLVDEILAVGDLQFQQKCKDKMLEFKKNGVTMVFVSHALGEVKSICDRVMWIENHAVKMIGPVAPVVDAYWHSFQTA